jgi:hypothetical protein
MADYPEMVSSSTGVDLIRDGFITVPPYREYADPVEPRQGGSC